MKIIRKDDCNIRPFFIINILSIQCKIWHKLIHFQIAEDG